MALKEPTASMITEPLSVLDVLIVEDDAVTRSLLDRNIRK
jgi:hypothetical protein